MPPLRSLAQQRRSKGRLISSNNDKLKINKELKILTPASKTKKGRRQFIEGLPDNLWPWLERAPAAAFKMTPRQYALRRQKAFERAGLLVTKAQAKKAGTKPKAPPKFRGA